MIKLRPEPVETFSCGWLPPAGSDCMDGFPIVFSSPPMIPPPPKEAPLPVCAAAVKARVQMTKKILRALVNLYIRVYVSPSVN